jgi:hypothetical protein
LGRTKSAKALSVGPDGQLQASGLKSCLIVD